MQSPLLSMERYIKNLRFEVAPGRFAEMELNLRKVVPKLTLPAPGDLALDFPYVIGQVLELDESDWQSLGLAASRSIPNYVLHQVYDAALFYAALRTGLLLPGFGRLAGERILLRLVAPLPEVLVKYRFYLGFAKGDGEIELVSEDSREVRPTIADPYMRLFSLQDHDVLRQVRRKFGPTVKLRRPGEEYVVADKGRGAVTLGFRSCLSRLFRRTDSTVRAFLLKVYKDVRIHEVHTGRIGDNAVFEVDDLVSGLVTVMNHIFTHDLALPFRPKERGPFRPPLFQVAGSRPLTREKSASYTQLATFAVAGTDRWYRASPFQS